jgi:hypothetical protein
MGMANIFKLSLRTIISSQHGYFSAISFESKMYEGKCFLDLMNHYSTIRCGTSKLQGDLLKNSLDYGVLARLRTISMNPIFIEAANQNHSKYRKAESC